MINLQIIDNSNQIWSALSVTEYNVLLYGDEVQALNAVEKNQAELLLLNYSLRKEETADYIKLILNIRPDSKIVVIADMLDEKEIVNCLLAGAKGYQEIRQLEVYASKLIQVIVAGEVWITRHMVAVLLDSLIKHNTVVEDK